MMTYKIPFDLSRDLVDACIKIHGRETTKSALLEALDRELRKLSDTPKESRIGDLRVLSTPDGIFVIWADIVKLCALSNPTLYLRPHKRGFPVSWRAGQALAVPVDKAFDFLVSRKKRTEAFALAAKYVPKKEYIGDVDEDGRPVAPEKDEDPA